MIIVAGAFDRDRSDDTFTDGGPFGVVGPGFGDDFVSGLALAKEVHFLRIIAAEACDVPVRRSIVVGQYKFADSRFVWVRFRWFKTGRRHCFSRTSDRWLGRLAEGEERVGPLGDGQDFGRCKALGLGSRTAFGRSRAQMSPLELIWEQWGEHEFARNPLVDIGHHIILRDFAAHLREPESRAVVSPRGEPEKPERAVAIRPNDGLCQRIAHRGIDHRAERESFERFRHGEAFVRVLLRWGHRNLELRGLRRVEAEIEDLGLAGPYANDLGTVLGRSDGDPIGQTDFRKRASGREGWVGNGQGIPARDYGLRARLAAGCQLHRDCRTPWVELPTGGRGKAKLLLRNPVCGRDETFGLRQWMQPELVEIEAQEWLVVGEEHGFSVQRPVNRATWQISIPGSWQE